MKKRLLAVLLTVCMVISMASTVFATESTEPTIGTGTESDPFIVSSLDDLKLFRDMVNGGNTFDGQFVKLTADINLNGETWTPIGNGTNKFLGTFDGNNKTVNNLVVSVDGNHAGLFGFASVVKNLKLVNATVSGVECVGALVGELESSVGTVDNCHVSGIVKITGENSVGGLVGKGYANIENCTVTGDGVATSFVLGQAGTTEEGDNVGGIIGHLGEGHGLGVTNSIVKNIKVSGTRKVGGIVGTTNRVNDYVGNTVDGVTIECTATAKYADDNASTTTIGGIVGNYFGSSTSGGILQSSTVKGVTFIVGNAKSAGALVGGDRENNGGAPVGIEIAGNTATNVAGATNNHLLPTHTVAFTIPEEARVFVEKPNGDRVKAEDDGTYELIDGTYYYTVVKEGYNTKYGRFTVRGSDVDISVELSVYVPFIPVIIRPVYAPNISDSDNGVVTVSPAKPEKGDTVVIVATPEEGYEIEAITVTDKNGEAVTVLDNGNGTYIFVQPKGSVTITVTFAQIVVPDEPDVPVDPDTPDEPEAPNFADVDAEAYYYDAVLWAVEGDITSGTTETAFSPDDTCTRAQAVTFLWRAAGSPESQGTVMPFTDIDADAYYYDAVLWAVENGITGGTTDTKFSPDADCTRAQIVTFLWRYNSAPNDIALNLFADVNAEAYYYSAVLWAVKNDVTNGTSETTFSPDNNCTRAQIVTFMFRCMSELEA